MKKVLITSSLMYDFIMDFPGKYEEHIIPEKIKTLSITFRIDHLSKNFGGNGGNISYTLSMLDVSPTLMTSVGSKDSEPFLAHLKKNGVKTDYINVVPDEFTGNCFIMTDSVHNQITGYYPGALREDATLTFDNIADLADHEMLVISTSTPEAQMHFVEQAVTRKIPYLYAPGQETARLSGEQLRKGVEGAKIVILNDYELSLVAEKTGMQKGDLLKHAEILITTLGPEGSQIENQNGEIVHIGVAKTENPLDPTGAGDAYIAGFVAGYMHQLPLKTCGQMGALTATYDMEHYGTQKHTFSIETFKERYKVAFGEDLPL